MVNQVTDELLHQVPARARLLGPMSILCLACLLPFIYLDDTLMPPWLVLGQSKPWNKERNPSYVVVYVTTIYYTTNYTKSQLYYSIYAWTKKTNSILTQFMGHFKSVAMFWRSVVVLYFFYILG